MLDGDSIGRTAIIEMAQAAGLELAGGADAEPSARCNNCWVGSSSSMRSQEALVESLLVSAGLPTTDGGLGAVQAIGSPGRLKGIDLRIAQRCHDTFIGSPSV